MSIDLTNFNYNEFKAEAIEKIKSGQPLTGKGGILSFPWLTRLSSPEVSPRRSCQRTIL